MLFYTPFVLLNNLKRFLPFFRECSCRNEDERKKNVAPPTSRDALDFLTQAFIAKHCQNSIEAGILANIILPSFPSFQDSGHLPAKYF
ncbi:MAG: hypothetical protein H6Q13_2479 [Bacteroidetes bacterium]|jgi:hypothetical protein|nr:hypothetical protein [Bacteroidota bacterium]